MLDPRPIIRFQLVPVLLFGTLLYFWPEKILSFILNVTELDGVHFHMARCIASFCIVTSPMFWFWTKSTDGAPQTTIIKFYVLFDLFALASTWYARIFAMDFVYSKTLCILMISCAMHLVFHVYLLIRSGWHMGRIEFEPDRQFILNRLLVFDTYAALFIGFLWMAYPDLLLRRQINFKLTQHHAYVCRIFGCFLSASNVFGNDAVYFQDPRNRRYGLISRFFANFFVLLSQFHSQYAYHQWWTNGHWVGMSLWTFWMCLVTLCLVNVFREKWK